jgi:hypothetical protein
MAVDINRWGHSDARRQSNKYLVWGGKALTYRRYDAVSGREFNRGFRDAHFLVAIVYQHIFTDYSKSASLLKQ